MFRLTPNSWNRIAAPARLLHSSPIAAKSVIGKVSEAADKVNKKMGKGLASAIDAGEKAVQTAVDSIDSVAQESKSKAEDVKRDTAQTASKSADNARQEKRDEA